MLIEWSRNVMLLFLDGLAGDHAKSAIGARHCPPEGLALGATLLEGDGLSDGAADGLTEGSADGLLDGDGEGDAVELGAGGGVGGSSRGTDVAVEERSMVCPPVNMESKGVTRLNWPVTVIEIEWSIDPTQFALTAPGVVTAVPSQDIEIWLAGTLRAELFVSRWTAHVIRLVEGPCVVSQSKPGWNFVGSWAAARAPSRAALAIVICE
jgi:hypothetical protein